MANEIPAHSVRAKLTNSLKQVSYVSIIEKVVPLKKNMPPYNILPQSVYNPNKMYSFSVLAVLLPRYVIEGNSV